jgi:hypothetical protein
MCPFYDDETCMCSEIDICIHDPEWYLDCDVYLEGEDE